MFRDSRVACRIVEKPRGRLVLSRTLGAGCICLPLLSSLGRLKAICIMSRLGDYALLGYKSLAWIWRRAIQVLSEAKRKRLYSKW